MFVVTPAQMRKSIKGQLKNFASGIVLMENAACAVQVILKHYPLILGISIRQQPMENCRLKQIQAKVACQQHAPPAVRVSQTKSIGIGFAATGDG